PARRPGRAGRRRSWPPRRGSSPDRRRPRGRPAAPGGGRPGRSRGPRTATRPGGSRRPRWTARPWPRRRAAVEAGLGPKFPHCSPEIRLRRPAILGACWISKSSATPPRGPRPPQRSRAPGAAGRVARLLEADGARRRLVTEVDALRAEQKRRGKEVARAAPAERGQALAGLKELADRVGEAEARPRAADAALGELQ